MTRKMGNLYYRPNMVVPYEWPTELWSRCIDEVERSLGRRRRPREVEFMSWLYFALQRGEIMGPTALNRAMGWKQNGGQTNMLSGTYSRIRRIVFEHAGLEEPRFAYPAGPERRWRWPEAGARPQPGQLGYAP